MRIHFGLNVVDVDLVGVDDDVGDDDVTAVVVVVVVGLGVVVAAGDNVFLKGLSESDDRQVDYVL